MKEVLLRGREIKEFLLVATVKVGNELSRELYFIPILSARRLDNDEEGGDVKSVLADFSMICCRLLKAQKPEAQPATATKMLLISNRLIR